MVSRKLGLGKMRKTGYLTARTTLFKEPQDFLEKNPGEKREEVNQKRPEEVQGSHAFFQETFQGVNNNCHMVFGHPRIKRKGDRTIANMFSHRKIA